MVVCWLVMKKLLDLDLVLALSMRGCVLGKTINDSFSFGAKQLPAVVALADKNSSLYVHRSFQRV